MFKTCRAAIAAFLLGSASVSHGADSDIEHLVINGFDVYLVNTHYGNLVSAGVSVQSGSWYDGEQPGIRHFWEHLGHDGSVAFPGQHTFNTIATRTGSDSNAGTSNTDILYYGHFHPDSLEDWLALQGSMISAPACDPDTFSREKSAVINEVNIAAATDDTALSNGIFLHLLPTGHPLKMYELGTEQQLRSYTQEDTQRLFLANFNPGMAHIIVAGNFDPLPDGTIPLDRARVKELVAHYYKPANPVHTSLDPTSPKKIIFPDLVPLDQMTGKPLVPQWLEIGSKVDDTSLQKNHLLELVFQAPSEYAYEDANFSLDLVGEFISSDSPGSLMEVLRAKDWITEISSTIQIANNLVITTVGFDLTDEGARHRHEIPSYLFASLHRIAKTGLTPSEFEFLKKAEIANYQDFRKDAGNAMTLLSRLLPVVQEVTGAFDFDRRLNALSPAQIQRAARDAFRIDTMLGGYLGPDVHSGHLDPIFKRLVSIPKETPWIESWKKIQKSGKKSLSQLIEIQVEEVKLKSKKRIRQNPPAPAHFLEKNDHTKVVLEENHALPIGAIYAALRLPPMNLSETVALEIQLAAFDESMAGTYAAWESQGISVELYLHQGELSLGAKAQDSRIAKEAVQELLKRVTHFAPDLSQVDYIAESFLATHGADRQDHPAVLSSYVSFDLLSPFAFPDSQKAEFLRRLRSDPGEKSRLIFPEIKRADWKVVFVGNFDEKFVSETIRAWQRMLPGSLSDAERNVFRQNSLEIVNPTTYWERLETDSEPSALGIARVYSGPRNQNLREEAAFLILGKRIHTAAFGLLRTERELGYIHGAGTNNDPFRALLTLHGQTTGRHKHAKIEQGWKEILDRIKTRTLSDDHFETEKMGSYREGRLIAEPQLTAEALVSILDYSDDLQVYEKSVALIPSLTEDEIYKVAEKYLLTEQYLSVFTSSERPQLESCRRLFTDPDAAKKELQGK